MQNVVRHTPHVNESRQIRLVVVPSVVPSRLSVFVLLTLCPSRATPTRRWCVRTHFNRPKSFLFQVLCSSVIPSYLSFPIFFFPFVFFYSRNTTNWTLSVVLWSERFIFFFFNLVVILCPHFRFSYLVPQIVLLYNSRVLVVYFYLRLRLSVWWSNGRLQFSCENRRARLQQRWLCQIVQWTLLATQRREQSSVPASTSDHRNCTNKTVSNQRYIFKIFFIPHRFCRNSVT